MGTTSGLASEEATAAANETAGLVSEEANEIAWLVSEEANETAGFDSEETTAEHIG